MAMDVDASDERMNKAAAETAHDNIWAGGGTLSWWQFLRDTGTDNRYAFDLGAWNIRWRQPSGSNYRLFFSHNFSTTAGQWFSPFPASIPAGVLQHIAVTYNKDAVGNDPIFYVDGVAVGVSEAAAPVGTADDDSGNILSFGSTGGANADSIYEDMRMYSRILSQDEIETIHAAFGVDGIVDGLVQRFLYKEDAVGQSFSGGANSLIDVSPSQEHGDPFNGNESYAGDTLKTRRKVA